MLTVKEERLRNEDVRKKFYNISTTRQMIAARQMSNMGKIVRHITPNHIPKQLLTAWVNNPRPSKRGILFTNKRILVDLLNMLDRPI